MEKKREQIECNRCGKCCLAGEGNLFHWCEYLFFTRLGTPTCMIYEKRLGKAITGGTCIARKDTKYDYPGCPFNTNKPIHPFWEGKN